MRNSIRKLYEQAANWFNPMREKGAHDDQAGALQGGARRLVNDRCSRLQEPVKSSVWVSGGDWCATGK